ncbi:MAG: hypothetical protein IKG21_12860 [Atopobiaceae bacterium]|nr:hypothetical protein [Atopobiaceae bacterium]
MANRQVTSEYAGRRMTLGELLDARSEVEQWALKEFFVRDNKLYSDIAHLCTLAQGMWFKTRVDE